MCVRILDGRAGETAELDAFEHTQSELIGAMAWFKTHLMSRALQLDPLTGLPLRYGLDDTFAQLQKKCSRDQTQLYVAMIDIDHFKSINDTHGHATGDGALRHVADTLKSIVRQHEPLYRYGGEEFLLLMQCHSVETAAVAAQRIVNRVRNVPLQLKDGQQLGMTVTLGLAQAKLTGVTALDDALALADNALYAGKRAGRNQYAVLEA
jgi:diguanylate cyclase (GGDEF)-like protein